MNLLTIDEIRELSFPDCIVENMLFDIPNRIMTIKTNSGFLSIKEGIKLGSCKLTIENWQSLNATLYRTKTKKWENLNINNIESLVDICEFEYSEEIIFRGFGIGSHQWIEIILSKATLKVEYDRRK